MAEHPNDDEVFSVNPAEAEGSVGADNVERFLRLYQRLYHERREFKSFEMRFAPSIMARSESELFGTSSPRFAVRVYLDKERKNFVNLRRLAELSEQLADATWKPIESLIVPNKHQALQPSIAHLLRHNNCIGDSLLFAPDVIKKRYHVLDAELGFAFGEGQQIRATPYVQPMTYFGGACAQACCFMAQAMLHDFALSVPDDEADLAVTEAPRFTGIYGVAEITAIITQPQERHLEITGLNWLEIRRYLEEVGRSALAQRSLARTELELRWPQFHKALRAYAISGIPVILCVNCSRFERCVYSEQSHKSSKVVGAVRNSMIRPDHAIVLIGCGRTDKEAFLVNDPKRFPFVETTFAQMREYSQENSFPLPFIAIQPSEVKLSLETQVRDDNCARSGVFDLARLLQREWPQWKGKKYPQLKQEEGKHYDSGEFQLVRMSDLVGRKDHDGKLSECQIVPTSDRLGLASLWSTLDFLKGTWCWIQWMPSTRSVWIWNAEVVADPCWTPEAPAYPKANHFKYAESALLRVFCKREDNQWVDSGFRNPNSPNRRDEVSSDDSLSRLKAAVTISLISSFATEGLPQITRSWPSELEQALPCEYYAFMRRDPILRTLQRALSTSLPARASALQVMACASERADLIENVATELMNVRDRSGGQIDVVALASYLPELSAEEGANAIAAVCFLIRLSKRLSKLAKEGGRGNGLRVIELVAGGRVTGISPITQEGANSTRFFAHQCSSKGAIAHLISNLRQAVEISNLQDDSELAIALELEPGPLYVLNDLESMGNIAQAIEKAELSNCVGFNLDVAHFALAGISPKRLKKYPELVARICHAHLSDHGQGHFGDVTIGEAGLGRGGNESDRLAAFKPWLQLIIDRSLMDKVRPKFSGFMSIELEAARGGDVIGRSLRNLCSIYDVSGQSESELMSTEN